MRRSVVPDRLLAVSLALLALPAQGFAQARSVVSKQVSVGSTEAALAIEFQDGGRLDVALRDGSVILDDRTLGSFERGGALDGSWRALLGQAIALENGALARALIDWDPPAGLSGPGAGVADALDRGLEDALELPAVDAADTGGISVSIGDGTENALAKLLVGSLGRLSVIQESLEGLGSRIRVHIEEDLDVPPGTSVEGPIVVIDGDARIAGEIRGDLVVVDGSVALEDGSRITGELRLADTRLLRNEGTVEGGVVDVLATERSEADDLREQLRSELRDEIRRDLRDEIRDVTRGNDRGFSLLSPIRSVVRGVGGLIETVFIVLVLGLLGAGAVAFAGPNLDMVADTARQAPGRAAAVGMAGTFLLIPVWILGAVALVVSIVGIPVAIAWLPLFPAAVLVAALFGYVAVARNAGEWLADSGYAWTDWIRKSNPVHTIFAGLVGLMLAFAVADVISILPFFGILSGLLVFLGTVLTFLAAQIGFGAVILTRGGRRREYWPMDSDEAWAEAMDVDADLDAHAQAGTSPSGENEPEGGTHA